MIGITILTMFGWFGVIGIWLAITLGMTMWLAKRLGVEDCGRPSGILVLPVAFAQLLLLGIVLTLLHI